jgi:hypothetical protein
MKKISVLLFLLVLIILFSYKTNDNFKSINNLKPFYYGRINSPTDYIDRSYNYQSNYPTYFKLGEVDFNIGPNKNYDKYLSTLHNKHMKERISNYNYSCPCQKLSN